MIYRRSMTEHVSGDDARLPQRRHLVTEIPGPASRELLARRERAVARGVSHVLPVFVTDAGGGVIVDADGNSLIDFGSGIAVVSVGNAAPRVSARVAEQAARFTHTCFMVTPYEGYVEVCEELARRTPGTHDKRSALFNSGAEAVENAVKIARHATGRQAVVAFDHAYHGRTNLTMALTAKNMPYKDKFGPFAGEIYRMPMAYPLRWPGGRDACAAEALATVKTLIHTQVGEDNVAALIIEPIQGEGGFVVPPDGFLPGLARRIGEIMRPRLHGLAEKYPVIADVRGRGAMLAIELTRPGTLDPDPATTAAVSRACHQAGLVTLTCGTFGNVIRFLPPLVIGEDLLDEGLSILEDAFAAV